MSDTFEDLDENPKFTNEQRISLKELIAGVKELT